MKTIVILGPFPFPSNNAAARRILGIARTLKTVGYTVKIASGQMAITKEQSKWYEGFEVYSLNERDSEHLPRWLKHLNYITMGKKSIEWLDSLEEKPDSIILYSGYSPYLIRLMPWTRKKGVTLIFDAVEWYEPPSTLAWLTPYYLNIELALRLLLPRVGNIISISNFFYDSYLRKGCRSILIPPTLDVKNLEANNIGRKIDDDLCLVYAGTPGRKDLLNNIIEAVLRLRKSGFSVQLKVAGVNKNEGMKYAAISTSNFSSITAGVEFLGLLSHEATLELVKKSDFSVLLRNDARYSRAGFPTKFVESFAVGTPVIGNLTSDLQKYLIHGESGIVCSDHSPDELVKAIKIACKMTSDQHSNMRIKCNSIALNAFDYRSYADPLSDFLLPRRIN